MLEVVPGSTNTGTVIEYRLATLGSKRVFPLYGHYVERENVDIDLIQFNPFFKVENGSTTYKDTV